MVLLRNIHARNSTIGALLVITGVVIKNSLEQLGMPQHSVKYIGMLSFLLGWIITAYSLSLNPAGKLAMNRKTLIAFGSSFAIVFAVMAMKKAMGAGKKPAMYLPAMFAGAWLTLGYISGWGRSAESSKIGIAGAICVLISMLVALPWQRKKCVVDGIGLPLFVIGWVLVIMANSIF